MTDKNRNLLIRVISALTLLPLVLWLISKGGYWFGGMLSVASVACAWEYLEMTVRSRTPLYAVILTSVAVLPLVPVAWPESAARVCLLVFGFAFCFAWVWHLFKGPLTESADRSAHSFTTVVYTGGTLAAVTAIRELEHGGWWVVATLVVTWMNDTCAYFAGRFLGKHKLSPQVSPNKTWEGFFGGMLGAVAALLFILRPVFFSEIRVVDCIALGVVGGIFGPLGDLCESMIKRTYGVKDSGHVLPGHGGMLDRVDALLFNGPVVLVYLLWVRSRI